MKELQIGQRVHCTLYGGKDGTIYQIHGEQAPGETKSMMGGVCVTGGRAHFDIVWDEGSKSQHIPESLVRQSVQWRVLEEPLATASEIQVSLDYCDKCTAEAKAEQERANIAFKAEQERLLAEYPKLQRVGGEASGGKLVAINLRILLKEAFPGVKFSVKSDYSSVGVRWEDGPTRNRVKSIVERFKSGYFDGMEDIYKYEGSPWNCLFGDVEYNSINREYSDEHLEFCIDKLYEHYAPEMSQIERRPAAEMKSNRDALSPSVDISIEEAIRTLASAWDPLEQKFDTESAMFRYQWLVRRVANEEESKLAQHESAAPAP